MSSVVYNNKRRGRGAMTKIAKRCLNRLKVYMNEAPRRLVRSKSSFARRNFRRKFIVSLTGRRKSRKIKIKP